MPNEPTEYLQYQRARFASPLPVGFLYTADHFWIGRTQGETWHVGLTRFGARMLGEIVDFGFDIASETQVSSGQAIGWVEGFKAVLELHCVASGHFLAANAALEKQITLVNHDPFGAGWLYCMKGKPGRACVDVHGYAAILDHSIDQYLQQQAGRGSE